MKDIDPNKLTFYKSLAEVKPGDLICCVNNNPFYKDEEDLPLYYHTGFLSVFLSHKEFSNKKEMQKVGKLFLLKILVDNKVCQLLLYENNFLRIFKKYNTL